MTRPPKKRAKRPEGQAPTPLPSRDDIRKFIASAGGRVGKREVARAFKLGPEHQVAIRGLLKSLAHEGQIAPAGHKRFAAPGRLPETSVVIVTGTDKDGDPIARPVGWQGDAPPPVVFMHPEPPGRPALAPGQRVLARLKPMGHGKYEGRTLKRLNDAPARVLGVFRAPDRLVPTDRRAKAEWRIPEGETLGAESDDIVLAEPLPGSVYGLKPATIIERLGMLATPSWLDRFQLFAVTQLLGPTGGTYATAVILLWPSRSRAPVDLRCLRSP